MVLGAENRSPNGTSSAGISKWHYASSQCDAPGIRRYRLLLLCQTGCRPSAEPAASDQQPYVRNAPWCAHPDEWDGLPPYTAPTLESDQPQGSENKLRPKETVSDLLRSCSPSGTSETPNRYAVSKINIAQLGRCVNVFGAEMRMSTGYGTSNLYRLFVNGRNPVAGLSALWDKGWFMM